MAVFLSRENCERIHLPVGGAGWLLVVTWNPNDARAYIDTHSLDPYRADGAPMEIPSRIAAFTTNEPKSIDHPDAVLACDVWIRNRKAKFIAAPPIAGRTPKDIDVQASELHVALNNLWSLATRIQNREDMKSIGHLFATLRSLLFWTKDTTREWSYSPLLLRMASKADLPLPVFGWKDSLNQSPSVLQTASFYMSELSPSMTQASPNQTLMDLQEWLKEEVVVIRSNPGTGSRVEDRFPLLEVIGDAANTLGVAHYDEDSSNVVTMLSSWSACDIDLLARSLCQVALVTGELSEWVIRQLADRRIINLQAVLAGSAS